MRREPAPPPPRWRMEVFEVVPGLFIATRLAAGTEYRTLGVDAIIDLEDWEDVDTASAGRRTLRLPSHGRR